MLFGLDPVTTSTILLLAASSSGADLCPARAPTQINIVPRTEDVKYETRQTLKQIQGYSMDTVDPYGFHGTTITQGFMKGSIGLEQKIKFGQAIIKKYNAACIWYDTITVEIKIDPTIVIAKELYADQCMRNAILGHELKHVRVDREIVNKYARTMGAKLMEALKSRGFSAGPFEADRLEEVSGKMQRVVHQILELEYQKLGIERQEKQRAVDNLEEYESVDDKCPNFEKRKEKLYSDLATKK